MCGLVYANSFNGEPVNNLVLQQFDEQRRRGTEGFGFFDAENLHMAQAANEDTIIGKLCKYESSNLLFHHRYPTSTKNVKRACHPFSTREFFGDTQYVLAHNGVISNSDELKKEHEKLGIKYKSVLDDGKFNDSEALLWDFALYMEGRQAELKAKGSIAFICIETVNKETAKLHFGRNTGSPLKLLQEQHGMMLSSEGEGVVVESNKLGTWDFAKGELSYQPLEILTNYVPHYNTNNSYQFGNYGNYQRSITPVVHDPSSVDEYIQSLNDYYDDDDDLREEYSISNKVERADLHDIGQLTKAQEMLTEYLIHAHGNFETAYWLLEADYDDLEEVNSQYRTDKAEEELQTYELAIQLLSNNPEYVNEKSESSLWRTIWTQAVKQVAATE